VLSKFSVYARVSERETEQRDPRAALSGHLYLRIDEDWFPAKNWVDYVLPVLAQWLQNVTVLYAPDSEVKNRFMDGSMCFAVRRPAASTELTVEFDFGGQRSKSQHQVSVSRYLASLRGAARDVLQQIDARNLPHGPDVVDLASLLQQVLGLEERVAKGALP